MSLGSQILLWKLDFNRFLIVTFLLVFFITHTLEGFTFKRICLNFPLKIQFANTPAIAFAICTVTGAIFCMLTSLSMATRPHLSVQVTDYCNREACERIEAILQLPQQKVPVEWILRYRRALYNRNKCTEFDLNFIGRDVSRKCKYFPDMYLGGEKQMCCSGYGFPSPYFILFYNRSKVETESVPI